MTTPPFQDKRQYFILPQTPEDASYYTYGTPGAGRAQYAHPKMLTFLFLLEHRWGAISNAKIGIGNISLANGSSFPPHSSHMSGLEVDIRPFRKDKQQLAVRYQDAEYDRVTTQRFIDLIWQTNMVKRVMFNDRLLNRVRPMAGHDNHLHIEVNI